VVLALPDRAWGKRDSESDADWRFLVDHKRLNFGRQLHLRKGQVNGEQDDKDNCKHLRDG
jgi:hypothetical protein